MSLILSVCAAAFLLYGTSEPNIEWARNVERQASIKPEYNDTVIPPNMAPLNFVVLDKGKEYFVRIYSTNGETVKVSSKTGRTLTPSAISGAGTWASSAIVGIRSVKYQGTSLSEPDEIFPGHLTIMGTLTPPS